MSFITGNDPMDDYWIVGDISQLRKLAIRFQEWHGVGPKLLPQDRSSKLYNRALEDPLFDVLFVQQVVANWQLAKAEIDELVTLWMAMDGQATDYAHWFADKAYHSTYEDDVAGLLQRIYLKCGLPSGESDRAYTLMVAGLYERSYQQAYAILTETEGELDIHKVSKADVVRRLKYLAAKLNKVNTDAAIGYYRAS